MLSRFIAPGRFCCPTIEYSVANLPPLLTGHAPTVNLDTSQSKGGSFALWSINMIYLIACGDFVKIGVSSRPWDRLAEFQTANPLPLTMLAVGPGDYGFETELHRQFGEYRGVGEWFQNNDRIRAVVAFLRQTFPDLQNSTCADVAIPEGATEQSSDEWRIETRTYTKKDGTTSTYHNYRRRRIDVDPETGKRTIAYRAGGTVDDLPRGDRRPDELADMDIDGWRIETWYQNDGKRYWRWRKRGHRTETRYGGRIL